MKLTKQQSKSLLKVHARHVDFGTEEAKCSFLSFRRKVLPEFGGGTAMIQVGSLWLGIEPDGYTHS